MDWIFALKVTLSAKRLMLAVAGVAIATTMASNTGRAQQNLRLTNVDTNVKDAVAGILGVLSLTVVPDSTADALTISSASGSDPVLNLLQIGGGFTTDVEDVPVYLEGYLGAARFDPTFIVSGEESEGEIAARWTSVAGTGGIGIDMAIAENLVFRPIFNFSLGYVTSSAAFSNIIVPAGAREDADFLDDGSASVGAFGGSLMLDYMLHREAYEVDIELRYTRLRLETIRASAAAAGASANAEALGVWARVRVPTEVNAFGRPLRAVVQFAHTRYLGVQAGALGFEYLTKIGTGLELDVGALELVLDRARVTLNAVVGDKISGFSLGFGLSF